MMRVYTFIVWGMVAVSLLAIAYVLLTGGFQSGTSATGGGAASVTTVIVILLLYRRTKR